MINKLNPERSNNMEEKIFAEQVGMTPDLIEEAEKLFREMFPELVDDDENEDEDRMGP